MKNVLLFVCLLSLYVTGECGTSVEQAESRVDTFHTQLIEMMQLEDHAAREGHITPIVEQSFDLPRIGQISLGLSWKALSEAQRAVFVDLLSQLIASTYADRFGRFNGHTFAVRSVQEARTGVLVRTTLTTPERSSNPVQLDYFLSNNQIFNVVADGVSDLSLRRAEYSRKIKADGFDALVDDLRNKVAAARAAE